MTNPKLRFAIDGELECRALSSLVEPVKDKNTNKEVDRVLTNSAEFGVVSQSEYFDRDIAQERNIDKYTIVKQGDFVYNPRISSCAPAGPINRSREKVGIVSPLYTVFRLKTGDVLSDYLDVYFRSNIWVQYAKLVANYGARFDRMNIAATDFYEMPIFVPNINEQKKIADFFTAFDDKITLAERKLTALQNLKSGLMQKIFSREIRFKREDGSDFSEWKKSTLAEVSAMVTVGIANAARHAYCDAENGIPMLRNMNIKPNRLDDSDVVYITKDFADNYSKKTLAENDVLVCRTGVPGTACLVPKKYVGAQTFTTLIVRLLPAVEPRYVCQYINSPLAKKYIDSTTIGGGQKNSGAGIISTLPIALPCKEEQQRIADILADVDAKIKIADVKLALLNRQKQAFLQQMFV